MAPRFVGTAPVHLRTALHLLGELDDQLRQGLPTRERHALVLLLAATRRQLWLAVVALEADPRVARRSAVMTGVGMVVWALRAMMTILCAGLALLRAALRVVRLARVMWP